MAVPSAVVKLTVTVWALPPTRTTGMSAKPPYFLTE
jgi:hypothetical protein